MEPGMIFTAFALGFLCGMYALMLRFDLVDNCEE
jgi:hypothetical protein